MVFRGSVRRTALWVCRRPAGPAGGGFRGCRVRPALDRYSRRPLQTRSERSDRPRASISTTTSSKTCPKRALKAESAALKDFRARLAAIDPATLTLDSALDREQLMHSLDAGVLGIDTIRMWAKDPDTYSSDVTNAAYVIMKRNYAPAADRLKALIAREKKMPAALAGGAQESDGRRSPSTRRSPSSRSTATSASSRTTSRRHSPT